MANYLLSGLTPLQSVLFSGSDHLDLGQSLATTGLSVTTSGAVTTLGVNGTTVALPTLALSSASQSGNVTFEDGTTTMFGTNNGEPLHGTGGNDAIYAMDGNDNVDGGDGNDFVFGGAGSDTIFGGGGNDHLYGSDPNGSPDGGDNISGGDGSDYIQGNGGDDTLDGGSGTDRIFGGQGNDYISGGIGNDAINGNLGNDHIDGGDGEDIVRGGKGDDVVTGGSGDDTVLGDLGADTLSGGSGHDLFQFHGNDTAVVSTDLVQGHIDTITDFTAGEDHLSLGFVPATIHMGAAGNVTDALAWATAQLTGHGSDVAEATVGHDTYLFYSSGAGAVADSVVELQGVTAVMRDAFV